MSDTTLGNAPRSTGAPGLRESWGWILAIGILFLVGGVLAIGAPVLATVTVAIYVGVTLAVGGVFAIIHAFRIRSWGGFLWELLIGVVSVAGGAFMVLYPLLGALTLTWVLAVVFVAKGIFQVMMGWRMRPQRGWGWMLAAGIVAILAGVVIILGWPVTGLYAPGTIAGISLVISGITYIMLALAVRGPAGA